MRDTTTADLFAPSAARAARDDGMRRAVDHADAVSERWSDRAYNALRGFTGALPVGTLFTSEQVRRYAELHGLPAPPDQRAWGAVMMRGRRVGLFSSRGYATSENEQAHCRPVTQWARC